jgi:hypothetical protein
MPSTNTSYQPCSPMTSKRLKKATYQLLQIPAADLHVALILIQALSELLRIRLTASRTPAVLLGLISLRRNSIILRCLLGGSSGTATEESADCVADRRAYCNTTKSFRQFPISESSYYRWSTYAAVLAICPKRPGPCDCCWVGGACCCAGGWAAVVAGRVCWGAGL